MEIKLGIVIHPIHGIETHINCTAEIIQERLNNLHANPVKRSNPASPVWYDDSMKCIGQIITIYTEIGKVS